MVYYNYSSPYRRSIERKTSRLESTIGKNINKKTTETLTRLGEPLPACLIHGLSNHL